MAGKFPANQMCTPNSMDLMPDPTPDLTPDLMPDLMPVLRIRPRRR
jgi:hypothetical protein